MSFGSVVFSSQMERVRPVIIHRAILGSVERMIAILCENYSGKWYAVERISGFLKSCDI